MTPLLLLVLACPSGEEPAATTATPRYLADDVVEALSMERVKAHVDVLADDATGGRIPGSIGHRVARDYLLGELDDVGLMPFGTDGYLHTYATTAEEGVFQVLEDGSIAPAEYETGTNLVGLIPGTDPELADQYIVVMAHYDHLGVTEDGEIFNGAFDDIAGVALLLEIARTFRDHDLSPRRSLVFLLTDEEEMGLEGAEAWLADSMVPHGDITFAISVDPLGRGVLPDVWPLALMGLERSPKLQEHWRDFARYSETDVVFIHRDIIPVFSSDQDEFYAVEDPIPALWFTSPGMAFYHTPEDTPETIDYRTVQAQGRFLLQALSYFADADCEFDYTGAPEIGPEHAADARAFMEAVLRSEELSEEDREEVEAMMAEVDAVIEADSLDALSDTPEVFFTYAIYFLAFILPMEHVGEIPPPFPDGG